MLEPRLIVALDFPDTEQADRLVQQLRPQEVLLKVGFEAFVAAGPAWVTTLQAAGFGVFLDLKFHDIPNTVARACRVAAGLGVSMLTVHASGGLAMLQAAHTAVQAENPACRVLAVTVLTSMDTPGLRQTGVLTTASEHVLHLGRLALEEAGVAGLICSPLEARILRDRFGERPLLVTPGIRPQAAEISPPATGMPVAPAVTELAAVLDDQQRISTPRQAILNGASHLVVGRPITHATDPAQQVAALLAEINGAWAERPSRPAGDSNETAERLLRDY
jgi:orotidine-5'-phosphate decarboxylase